MANLIKLSSQPTDNHLTHHRAEPQNNNPFLVKKERRQGVADVRRKERDGEGNGRNQRRKENKENFFL